MTSLFLRSGEIKDHDDHILIFLPTALSHRTKDKGELEEKL